MSFVKPKTKTPACPKCGLNRVKEIFYGLPSSGFAESRLGKQYHLAGCVVTGNDPKWKCYNARCRHEWGKREIGRARFSFFNIYRIFLP